MYKYAIVLFIVGVLLLIYLNRVETFQNKATSIEIKLSCNTDSDCPRKHLCADNSKCSGKFSCINSVCVPS